MTPFGRETVAYKWLCLAEILDVYGRGAAPAGLNSVYLYPRESALCDVQDKAGAEPV